MLYLAGTPVTRDDRRTLVDLLLRLGTADCLSAAAMIEKGIERDLYAVALTRAERDAVLGALDDPSPGLVELRGRLAREHRQRS